MKKLSKAIKLFLKYAEIKNYPKCQVCGDADPYADPNDPYCYKHIKQTTQSSRKKSGETFTIDKKGITLTYTINSIRRKGYQLFIDYTVKTENNEMEVKAGVAGANRTVTLYRSINGHEFAGIFSNENVFRQKTNGPEDEILVLYYVGDLTKAIIHDYFEHKGIDLQSLHNDDSSKNALFSKEKLEKQFPNETII